MTEDNNHNNIEITPKISCIVPVYNVEKYLNRCVDSILSQTFTDFELILVDDGSPDNSGKICDEYDKMDNRIKVIHQENKGVSSARNAGLDAAQGEYICFVDSDDWVAVDYMQTMYDEAIKYNLELVICGFKCQDKEGNFNDLNFIYDDENIVCQKNDEILKIFCCLRGRLENAVLLHSPVNKLYYASLLTGVRFDENISMGEDYLFNLCCFEKTKTASFLAKNLYYYFFNELSAIHTFKEKNILDNLVLSKMTFEFCIKHNLRLMYAEIFNCSILCACVRMIFAGSVTNSLTLPFGYLRSKITVKTLILSLTQNGNKGIIMFFVLLFYKLGWKKVLLFLYKKKNNLDS